MDEERRFVEELEAISPPSKLQELLETSKLNAPGDSLSPG